MTLNLFYVPGTCALAAHIALEEAGAPFEAVRLSFADNQQRSPEYLALNPKGRVPALVTDRGVITENIAILTYVAQAWPEAGLAPSDPFAFAQMQAMNSYLATTVHVAYAHGRRPYRWADDEAAQAEMKRKAPSVFADSFQIIEDLLVDRPYVLGDAYSLSDLYLFVFEGWLEGQEADLSRFPRLAAHYARVAARPAVRKILAVERS
ncbi:MAG: Glutathione S-transferase [Caulobacteraceae bacterium]|nr:Glutathione S-transferase [Caulobacteraceae bacterium]